MYAICAYERCNWNRNIKEPDMGEQDIPGLFLTAEAAQQALVSQAPQIYRNIFEYILIQEIDEGLFQSREYEWYRWNNAEQIYKKITRPSKLNNGGLMMSGQQSQTQEITEIGLIGKGDY